MSHENESNNVQSKRVFFTGALHVFPRKQKNIYEKFIYLTPSYSGMTMIISWNITWCEWIRNINEKISHTGKLNTKEVGALLLSLP